MIELKNLDPRGEYFRICPYCGARFIADHMNCVYCPEKNGKKNWCKNRYKRIAKEEKLREAIVSREELNAKWSERREKAKKAAKKHKTVSVSEQIGNNIESAASKAD